MRLRNRPSPLRGEGWDKGPRLASHIHRSDVGWGANPNIAIYIGTKMLGFAPQPTNSDARNWCLLPTSRTMPTNTRHRQATLDPSCLPLASP